MNYILSTFVGTYHSHTIKVNTYTGVNTIELKREDFEYSGPATQIIDSGDRISFIDKDGKKHEYIYRMCLTTT